MPVTKDAEIKASPWIESSIARARAIQTLKDNSVIQRMSEKTQAGTAAGIDNEAEYNIEIPEAFYKIPNSQEHLQILVEAMRQHTICEDNSQSIITHVLCLHDKAKQSKATGIAYVNTRKSQLKERPARHLKLLRKTDENTYVKGMQCPWASIKWNYTDLRHMEHGLRNAHCWDEETALLHGKVAKLMVHVSRGNRRYHKLQHLKCELWNRVNTCTMNGGSLSHIGTSMPKKPVVSTSPTTTTIKTTSTMKPTSSPITKPPTTAASNNHFHTVAIEVLSEFQRDIGLDYAPGIFDEPFLFY